MNISKTTTVEAVAGMSRREALVALGLAAGAGAVWGGGRAHAETPAVDAAWGGARQPGFYRFKIGAFDALALNDGAAARPVGQSPIGAGEPVEVLVAELREAFLPVDRMENQFNVLLVQIGSELVLIDSGAGAAMGASAGRLVENLRAAGVKPERVNAVMLSHAHRDHFGGLLDAETKRPVFTNATHYVGRKEYEFWMGSSPDVSTLRQSEEARKGMIAGARGVLDAEAFRGKWQLIAPGERLIEGLEIIDAAGHTPGHLAFEFSSSGERVLHFVDTANHAVLMFNKPGRAFAFDVNPAKAAETREKVLKRAAAERLRIFGAHLPFPALGHVRAKAGGGYEYVPEPWGFV